MLLTRILPVWGRVTDLGLGHDFDLGHDEFKVPSRQHTRMPYHRERVPRAPWWQLPRMIVTRSSCCHPRVSFSGLQRCSFAIVFTSNSPKSLLLMLDGQKFLRVVLYIPKYLFLPRKDSAWLLIVSLVLLPQLPCGQLQWSPAELPPGSCSCKEPLQTLKFDWGE